ncbi:MAG: aquaporin [Polyangiaceae bacterium]
MIGDSEGGGLNPARSIAAAMIEGGESILHVWLFVAAPLVGGALAGLAVRGVCGGRARGQ